MLMLRCARDLLFLATSLAVTALTTAAQSTPGRQISAGGRTWWLSCVGSGTPTVVLEAGHTEGADTWRQVQPQVAAFTRVCSYDRAGVGRSGPVPARAADRSATDVAGDLATLLGTADERGPFVLVGHSLGGPLVRVFAARVPTEVVGMVLIDAVNEREFSALDSLLTPAQRAEGAGMRPMSPEHFDIEGVLRQAAQTARPLSWPLIVVARGRPLSANEIPPSWTPAQRQRREQLRRTLQRELAALSPTGTLIFADSSGHHVHHDQPHLVVSAIRQLVETARRARGPGG